MNRSWSGSNPARHSFVWSHRVGECRISAWRRTGRHGDFLVFRLERVFPGGHSSSFTQRDLECLRPCLTHALRFARTWSPEPRPRSKSGDKGPGCD